MKKPARVDICSFILYLKLFLCSCYPVFVDASAEHNIDIVYHITTGSDWENIVQEQLTTLEQSALPSAANSITVTVVGPEILKVQTLFQNTSFYNKVYIIHSGSDLLQYESPGIKQVKEIALHNPNTHILYIHNTGTFLNHVYTPSNIRLWRRYMEYFAIEHWQDCIDALKTADICGVDWIDSPSLRSFFSGNFWWSRASYINTCELNKCDDCMLFIGTGKKPLVKSFYQSGKSPQIINRYTCINSPQYFFPISSNEHIQDVLNLYLFSYFDEYYRK